MSDRNYKSVIKNIEPIVTRLDKADELAEVVGKYLSDSSKREDLIKALFAYDKASGYL